jgi:hypothetical protein
LQAWEDGLKAAKDPTSAKAFKVHFFDSFKSAEDLQTYMRWWTQCKSPPPLLIPEADDYISTIMRTNFTRSGDIAHVTTILDLPASPYIPVGSFKGFHYRLLPHSRVLIEGKAPPSLMHPRTRANFYHQPS